MIRCNEISSACLSHPRFDLQVVTNPPPEEKLDIGDRVFVLRERGGPWLTAVPAN